MADVCSGCNLVILHVKCLPGTGSGFIFHHNGNSGSHYQQHNIARGLGLDNLHNISIQISINNYIPLCHLVYLCPQMLVVMVVLMVMVDMVEWLQ